MGVMRRLIKCCSTCGFSFGVRWGFFVCLFGLLKKIGKNQHCTWGVGKNVVLQCCEKKNVSIYLIGLTWRVSNNPPAPSKRSHRLEETRELTKSQRFASHRRLPLSHPSGQPDLAPRVAGEPPAAQAARGGGGRGGRRGGGGRGGAVPSAPRPVRHDPARPAPPLRSAPPGPPAAPRSPARRTRLGPAGPGRWPLAAGSWSMASHKRLWRI